MGKNLNALGQVVLKIQSAEDDISASFLGCGSCDVTSEGYFRELEMGLGSRSQLKLT